MFGEGSAAPAAWSIPNYDLLGRIGSSSHSEVWLARHRVLLKLRAVKIIRFEDVELSRFWEKEFTGVRCYEPVSREHVGLMDLFEVGLFPDRSGFWYVMELADREVPGADGTALAADPNDAPAESPLPTNPGDYRPRTLATELARRGRLSPRETLDLGLHLAGALAFLHSRNPPLVHRDIKPENVIYVEGQPKLGDPGMMTRVGERPTWCGTTGYVAPEGPGKPAADIYSLGKLLYTVATGYPPERFPDLPDPPENGPDHRLWQRLNALICHACEHNPAARYRSGRELLHDLERIRAGQKPRLARRRLVRSVLVSAILGGGLLLGLLWEPGGRWERRPTRLFGGAAVTENYRPTGVIFEDHFLENRLNPGRWTWNFWQSKAQPQFGQATRQVSVANGTLRLENQVLHEEGWNIKQLVWVLSRTDLKPQGDTVVEVELSGRAGNAHLGLALVAGDGPWQSSGELIPLFQRGGGRFQPAQIERVRVQAQLSPASGLALVHWTEPDGPHQRLVDVSALPAWRLVFLTVADSAAGMDAGFAQLEVHRVAVMRAKLSPRLAGWLTSSPAELPVPGVEVFNPERRAGAFTDAEGAYVVPALPGWNRLLVRSQTFQLTGPASPLRVPRAGLTRLDVSVRKRRFGRGDVREAWQISRQPLTRLALSSTHVYTLGGGNLCRFERGTWRQENLPPVPGDIGLCWAEDKLWSVGTHDRAMLFELDPRGLIPPQSRFALPTRWPMGLAWDGTNFWFAEFNDQHTNRFGVFAVDGRTGEVQVHLPCSDTRLCDVAWGAGRLWLTSATAGLYEVDPDRARQGGTLEAGILTNYPGLWGDIEFADGQLWLLRNGWLCRIELDSAPAEILPERPNTDD